MSTYNLDKLLKELNQEALIPCCPSDEHKVKAIIWTLQIIANDTGFSSELKRFILEHNAPIGSAYSKKSPVSFTPNSEGKISMGKTTTPTKETQPNYELAGAVVFVVPELVEVLERDGSATLQYDGDSLVLADSKPTKSKAKAAETTSPPPVAKKGGKAAPAPEEPSMSEEEFDELCSDGDYSDTEKLAEFATEQGVEWEPSQNEKVNRMRIINAVKVACGWKSSKK
jgi:hypothetical protein